ncbi:MAG: alanine--tRNA ligase [Dehalococcoidia bacterium]
MTIDELRRAFLAYFEARGHRRIPSSSLVPHGDPTLLFTTAGMVQFKPYFMGLEEPPARRLTSIQRCFRTTDVEVVGDENHLTLFEMLGNFSVGDYFKPEVIPWAWEFLTGVLQIPKDRLWATVFTDDDESAAIWGSLGVPPERILRYTAEQGNWWGPPGDTGPMGPCSEMHYDWGKTPGCAACDTDTCHPDVGCGRFLEIWNLVFMSYYREEDGSQTDLPAANIDTGAGLERLASVVQGVRAVYETDELRNVLAAAERVTGRVYDPDENPEVARGLRAITEHARALAFLVADGVLPSNEGRGYVLRRLLRRGVYFGHRLGVREPFLERVVDAAIDHSMATHPELGEQRDFIRRIARIEEARFQATLDRGLALLDEVMARESASKRIPGVDMFTLYDTHGLPPELTLEVAQGHGYEVDRDGFDAEMEKQRERSKGDEVFGGAQDDRAVRYAAIAAPTEFVGYTETTVRTTVTHLVRHVVTHLTAHDTTVTELNEGDEGEIVIAQTPFYPEGGGQVGDHGVIESETGRFEVTDTHRYGETVVQIGRVVAGTIAAGAPVTASIDGTRRQDTARNHTGTHLLHAALRSVLGTHVRQAGSYVGPDRLRFDYTHPESPSEEQLTDIQRIVNAKVRADIESATFELDYDEAIERGAIAFFEDRYTARVRMVEYCDSRGHAPGAHTMECYSRELCGGTHLHSTGQVGMLLIVSDSSIGAGLRRIEALTGVEAERFVEERAGMVNTLARHFRTPAAQVLERIATLEEQLATERRRLEEAERRASADAADSLTDRAEEIGGVKVLVARVQVESADALRPMADRLRDRLGSAFIALAADIEGRPNFIAAATDDVVARGLSAADVVKIAAGIAGGGGGGRPQLAQAGGRDASKIDEALAAALQAARDRLSS